MSGLAGYDAWKLASPYEGEPDDDDRDAARERCDGCDKHFDLTELQKLLDGAGEQVRGPNGVRRWICDPCADERAAEEAERAKNDAIEVQDEHQRDLAIDARVEEALDADLEDCPRCIAGERAA